MFGKNKKQEQAKLAEEQKKAARAKMEPYEIHVMPPKFHKYLDVKKSSGLSKIILIGVIVVVVGAGITIGVYFFIQSLNPEQPAGPLNLNQPITNLNENLNQPAPENTNTQPEINTNINTNENTNENVNTNTNINTNTNQPVTGSQVNYSSSLDSDNDKLTDVEEEMYGTEKNLPDTDADGYIDGQELLNGYNPKAAGSSLLANSGLVNKYINPVVNYEILHPADWLAKPTDQSLQDVIFQSATGEFVEIKLINNSDSLDLVDWYVQENPTVNIVNLDQTTMANGYRALLSPDRLTYYIVEPNRPERIFEIKYNIGTKIRVNFLTTFDMMLTSFKILNNSTPEPAPSPAETPSPEI